MAGPRSTGSRAVTGAVGGFGPFDTELPVGLTEYGGGAGLVEGSPTSQSGKDGRGVTRIENKDEVLTVDEKIGVVYRIPATGDVGTVDPETGLTADDV